MKSRRRRTVLLLLAFLGAGAIVNVAVAWGIATWGSISGDPDSFRMISVGDADRLWKARAPTEWQGAKHEIGNAHRGTAFGHFGLSVLVNRTPPQAGTDSIGIDGFGWPFYSLEKERRQSWTTRPNLNQVQYEWCIPIKWNHAGRGRAWPLKPIWPGFGINTILYAAILWLLFAFPFVLRGRRRIKRGLCAACAYPIGVSEVCTECGKPVSSAFIAKPSGQRTEPQ